MLAVGGFLIILGVIGLMVTSYLIGRWLPKKVYVVISYYPAEVHVFDNKEDATKYARDAAPMGMSELFIVEIK